MLKTSKSISYSGQSLIDNVVVAYMSANVPEDGTININKTIQNKDLFDQNKETVLADFSAFEDIVYGSEE